MTIDRSVSEKIRELDQQIKEVKTNSVAVFNITIAVGFTLFFALFIIAAIASAGPGPRAHPIAAYICMSSFASLVLCGLGVIVIMIVRHIKEQKLLDQQRQLIND